MVLRFKDGETLDNCDTIVKGRTFLLVRNNTDNNFLIINLKRLQGREDVNDNLQQQAQIDSAGEKLGS